MNMNKSILSQFLKSVLSQNGKIVVSASYAYIRYLVCWVGWPVKASSFVYFRQGPYGYRYLYILLTLVHMNGLSENWIKMQRFFLTRLVPCSALFYAVSCRKVGGGIHTCDKDKDFNALQHHIIIWTTTLIYSTVNGLKHKTQVGLARIGKESQNAEKCRALQSRFPFSSSAILCKHERHA